MTATDTIRNRSRQVVGKLRDLIGRATKNKSMRARGMRDMVGGEVAQRGSKARDRMTGR